LVRAAMIFAKSKGISKPWGYEALDFPVARAGFVPLGRLVSGHEVSMSENECRLPCSRRRPFGQEGKCT
jgi:hypothetical protein